MGDVLGEPDEQLSLKDPEIDDIEESLWYNILKNRYLTKKKSDRKKKREIYI